MRYLKGFFFFYLIIILLGACASQKNRKFAKEIGQTLDLKVFENHFTGILFYDPATRDTLFKKNSGKYFTPASNTKIYTLYAALNLLPERLPVLKYSLSQQKDTVYVSATGDPTQFHPYFNDSTALTFLKGFNTIAFYINNFEGQKYGPGWAWEDYDWYYSAERSSMPLYGNVVTIYNSTQKTVSPDYFKDSVIDVAFHRNRKQNTNTFFFDPVRKDTTEIPFITSDDLALSLLGVTLGRSVHKIQQMPASERKFVYGIASDSVYKRMMQQSDNFLAEQLLIQASSMDSDTLSSRKTREFVLDSLLSDLRQPPRWVDGSGLSRYNLFSPESMVHVLAKMYEQIPRARLFHLFPAGGITGTLEDWYPGAPDPYIFAKTGTLGNNHCVSGYLVTSSGKTLIFSFMNNHFRQPTSEVKKQMQRVFEWVRDNY